MTPLVACLFGTEASRALDRVLPLVFVFCALPLMVFIALAAPPGQSPDEPAHVIRAASLLEGQIVGARGPVIQAGELQEPTATVLANVALPLVAFAGTGRGQYYGADAHALVHRITWATRPHRVDAPNTASYAPFLYIPAALGMAAMQLSGYSPYDAFIAARCADAACYALLGAVALFLARRGKLVLFGVLLLPTALWLGGTVHPDGLMIGLSVLSAALLTGAEQSRARLWAAAIALGLVILARPPLIPLALLIAVPLGLRRSAGPVLTAALPGLLWAGFVMPRASVPFVHGRPAPGGPLWYGDSHRLFAATNPGVQAHILLFHPGLMLTLPLTTLLGEWLRLVDELFRVVGQLNLRLPVFIGALGVASVLAGVLAMGRDPANRRWKWLAGVAALTIIAIYDAQYISWTLVGSTIVQGVQGRYFFELIPFLALAGAPRPSRSFWAIPALALAACGFVAVPLAVLQGYYVK